MVEATRLAMCEFQSSKASTLPESTMKTNGILGDDAQQVKEEYINPTVFKERAKTWDKFVTQVRL